MILIGFIISAICSCINLIGTNWMHEIKLIQIIIDLISIFSYAGIYGPLWYFFIIILKKVGFMHVKFYQN